MQKRAQETEFVVNAAGCPISQGCVLCLATNKRMEPSLDFASFCEKCNSPPTSDYVQNVDRARQAIAEEVESNQHKTLPTFIPGCQISQQTVYGHEIYSKAALLSDSDILSHTGKTAVSLGLTPWSADANTPNSHSNFFVVSLRDLPPEVAVDVRKVKVFHSVSAVRDSLTCTPQTQISPLQSETVFGHAARIYGDQRPTGLTVLKTLPELVELATLLDNQLEKQALSDSGAAVGQEAVEQLIQSKVAVGTSKALEGLEDTTAPVPKKRRKGATAPGTTPSTTTAAAGGVGSTAIVGALTDGTSSKSGTKGPGSASSKRTLALEADFKEMDPEMAKVASVHTAGNRTASAKSLSELTVAKFMSDETDSVSKANAISSVAWFVH